MRDARCSYNAQTIQRVTMPDINVLATDKTSSARLPIVDISPYLDPASSAEARSQTASSLDSACREFGEYTINSHGSSAC